MEAAWWWTWWVAAAALAGSRRRPLKYVQVPVGLAKRHRPRRCTGRRRRSASRIGGRHGMDVDGVERNSACDHGGARLGFERIEGLTQWSRSTRRFTSTWDEAGRLSRSGQEISDRWS